MEASSRRVASSSTASNKVAAPLHCPIFTRTKQGSGEEEPVHIGDGEKHAQGHEDAKQVLWGGSMHCCFILNRSPTQSVDGTTPYEVWHGMKPKVHFLRTFCCVAHMKQGDKRLTKLEDQSTSMVFIGYEQGSKAWRFYDPVTDRVHVSSDAVFEEDQA
jgi:hypothetical protein